MSLCYVDRFKVKVAGFIFVGLDENFISEQEREREYE